MIKCNTLEVSYRRKTNDILFFTQIHSIIKKTLYALLRRNKHIMRLFALRMSIVFSDQPVHKNNDQLLYRCFSLTLISWWSVCIDVVCDLVPAWDTVWRLSAAPSDGRSRTSRRGCSARRTSGRSSRSLAAASGSDTRTCWCTPSYTLLGGRSASSERK